MADFTPADLDAIFKKYFGDAGPKSATPNDIADFIKNIKASTDEMKKSQPAMKSFKNLMEGTKTPMVDVSGKLDQLNKAIEETIKVEKSSASKAEKDAAKTNRAALESTRAEVSKAAALGNARVALGNLGVGIRDMAVATTEAAIEFAKGLQAGTSGTELYTAASVSAAKATGNLVYEISTGLAGLLGVVSLFLPMARAVKILTLEFSAFLGIVGYISKVAAEKVGEGLKYLGTEVENAKKSFKDATSAGANFAGGMTEMREQAATAGLNMQQFGTVIKDNKESLSSMGMGVTQAAKEIAKVSGILRKGELGSQLQNLGYSFEEQAGLAADVSAQLRAAGKEIIPAEVARLTVEYGKNLRVITDITGKDARKALEKARADTLKSATFAELTRTGNKDASLQLQGFLTSMPEELQKGFLELFNTGVITDVASNLLATTNSEYLPVLQAAIAQIKYGTGTVADGTDAGFTAMQKISKNAVEGSQQSQAMAQAAQLGSNGSLTAWVTLNDALLKFGTTVLPGETEKVRTEVEKLATTASQFDKDVRFLDTAIQRFAVSLMKTITPLMNMFVSLPASELKRIEDQNKDMVEAMEAYLSNKKSIQDNTAPGTTVFSTLTSRIHDLTDAILNWRPWATTPPVPGAGKATPTEDFANGKKYRRNPKSGEYEEMPVAAPPAAGANKFIKFTQNSGNLSHYNQLEGGTKTAFESMISELGQDVTVNSAYRSQAEQNDLIKKWKAAGGSKTNPTAGGITLPATHSMHTTGTALDIDPNIVNNLESSGLLEKYGFVRRQNDPGHISHPTAPATTSAAEMPGTLQLSELNEKFDKMIALMGIGNYNTDRIYRATA